MYEVNCRSRFDGHICAPVMRYESVEDAVDAIKEMMIKDIKTGIFNNFVYEIRGR